MIDFQPCLFCASRDTREKSFSAKNAEPHHAVTCARAVEAAAIAHHQQQVRPTHTTPKA